MLHIDRKWMISKDYKRHTMSILAQWIWRHEYEESYVKRCGTDGKPEHDFCVYIF